MFVTPHLFVPVVVLLLLCALHHHTHHHRTSLPNPNTCGNQNGSCWTIDSRLHHQGAGLDWREQQQWVNCCAVRFALCFSHTCRLCKCAPDWFLNACLFWCETGWFVCACWCQPVFVLVSSLSPVSGLRVSCHSDYVLCCNLSTYSPHPSVHRFGGSDWRSGCHGCCFSDHWNCGCCCYMETEVS